MSKKTKKLQPLRAVSKLITPSSPFPSIRRPVQQDQLWIDVLQPRSLEELAVHKKKVSQVRSWLSEAFHHASRNSHRILILTGPPGCGKTTTVRLLIQELSYATVEWQNAMGGNDNPHLDATYDSLEHKFRFFLERASACGSLRRASLFNHAQQLIIFEDLPNVMHPSTRSAFHNHLDAVASNPQSAPVVIILSDASKRGSSNEDTPATWYNSAEGTTDIRTVVPGHLLEDPRVTEIRFNPVAPTLMRRALDSLLSQAPVRCRLPPKLLPSIIETSNGDLRSAVTTLQLLCTTTAKTTKSSRKGKEVSQLDSSSSNFLRSESLELFHVVGKVLYNKRVGDEPDNSKKSTSAPPPPKQLPVWLCDEEREPSEIDVENLQIECPIDTGLLALYIQENYSQFCNRIEDCDGVAEVLSQLDVGGSQTLGLFYLLIYGTIHHLPTPMQKKPRKLEGSSFFNSLKKRDERCAELSRLLHQQEGTQLHPVIKHIGWEKLEKLVFMERISHLDKSLGKVLEGVHSNVDWWKGQDDIE